MGFFNHKTDGMFRKVEQITYSSGDYPWTWTYRVNYYIAKYFTYIFWKANVTPNIVTILGALVNVIAVSLLIWKVNALNIYWVITIGLIWQIGFSLDCADGSLARLTGKTSRFGAWFDLAIDFINHSLFIFGIFFLILKTSENNMTNGGYWMYFISFAFCLSVNLLLLFSSNIKKIIFNKEEKILPQDVFKFLEIIRYTIPLILDYGTLLFIVTIFLKFPNALFYAINIYSLIVFLSILGTGFMLYRNYYKS